MFGMCKTKHSSKGCSWCLLIVSKSASSLIINFEQVIEPFLVLNIYFTFSLSVVACTFYKSLLRVTAYYYNVTYTSEAVVKSCSVKKASARVSFLKRDPATVVFLWILQNFLSYRTPPVAASGIRVNLHSIVLELLAPNMRNICLSEQKIYGNITVRT